mmetsp:Transcript_44805/g.89481  ORF Transcript_44805/g.89481 Transcript_44805/m.89481 type:complete len:621 (-) Transcript_44805:2616-4478(-)
MPFFTLMRFISAGVHDVRLDPSFWMQRIGEGYSHLCRTYPAGFVAIDLTFFILLAIFILFQADISKWWAERKLRARGYAGLEEQEVFEPTDGELSDATLKAMFEELDSNSDGSIEEEEMAKAIEGLFGIKDPEVIARLFTSGDLDGDGEIDFHEFKMIIRSARKVDGAEVDEVTRDMGDPDAIRVRLRNVREQLEEVDLMIHLRGEGAEVDVKKELNGLRSRLNEQVDSLANYLSAMEVKDTSVVDLEAAAKAAEDTEAARKAQGSCAEYTQIGVTILKNTISGVLTIYLYFMDLISDVQVTLLFYHTGAYRFATVSACLVIGQFVVVWLRVLPYLSVTYGTQSIFYRTFLFLGMPFGCFFFDSLMFLGPFGLLTVIPMPEVLRLFIPAYAATRMIAEVLIEALPQWIMQVIIMVLVSHDVKAGKASDVDMALYHYKDGKFVALMPKSILFSSLTMLKTWYDLVQGARQAGISVRKKGVQLWNVGSGLPLDAIKAGSISSWGCAYEVSDQELRQLVDALCKNKSLERLDLSLAGFEWMPPVMRQERSVISSLLEVMSDNHKALEALRNLIISRKGRVSWRDLEPWSICASLCSPLFFPKAVIRVALETVGDSGGRVAQRA